MTWLLEHSTGALALGVAVWAAVRWLRPAPAVAHLLWLAVIVKLMLPPLLRWPVLPAVGIATPAAGSMPLPAGAPLDPAVLLLALQQPAVPPAAPGAEGFAWLLWLWAIGSIGTAVWLTRGALRTRRWLRRAAPPPAAFLGRVRALGARLGVSPPRVAVVADAVTPFVFGPGRPVLVWPARMLAPSRAHDAVLAHELAHLRRRDHWVARLEVLALIAFWWHPLLWLARSRMRAAAELACDAWALWAVPQARRDYAGALIDTLELQSQAAPAAVALGARQADRRAFEERLEMILHAKHSVRRRWSVLPVAALALTLAGGPTFAQEGGAQRAKTSRSEESLESKIEAAVRRALAEHGIEAEESEAETPAPATQRGAEGDDTLRRVQAELEAALDEARAEIRGDEDLRALGIAGDVERLVGTVLSGEGEIGDSLGSVLQKALAGGLRQAQQEIADDEDLRAMGLTDDVQGLASALLGGEGDAMGSLQGVVEKAMAHGLREAQREIGDDEDLRAMGLTDDVQGLARALLGGEGDAMGSLQGVLEKAMAQGLRHAQQEIADDEDLRAMGLTDDVQGLARALLGGEGDAMGSLQGLVEKAMAQGLRHAQQEIADDEDLRALGLTGDVQGLVGALIGGNEAQGNLAHSVERALRAARGEGQGAPALEHAHQQIRQAQRSIEQAMRALREHGAETEGLQEVLEQVRRAAAEAAASTSASGKKRRIL